jgi:hypothetical protein
MENLAPIAHPAPLCSTPSHKIGTCDRTGVQFLVIQSTATLEAWDFREERR